MKALLTEYTFIPASQQISITEPITLSLRGLLLITNVTDNIIIFNFADATLGATLSRNVLTLAYNTTAMSSDDVLQIWYDDANSDPLNTAEHFIAVQGLLANVLRVARQQRYLLQLLVGEAMEAGHISRKDISDAGDDVL